MYSLCTKVFPLPGFVATGGGAGEGGWSDICCVNWFWSWSQEEFSCAKDVCAAGETSGEFNGELPEDTELPLNCVLMPKDATEVVCPSFISKVE